MRFAYYLCSDHPMPAEDCRAVWNMPGRTGSFGFSLEEAELDPAELTGLSVLDEVYCLELQNDPETLSALKAYLEENMAPGSQVQLWRVVKSSRHDRRAPSRYRGKLMDLDEEMFRQLFSDQELCINITY